MEHKDDEGAGEREELRRRLRHAAAAHRPDRERMLARIERGMERPPAQRRTALRRPVAPWLRVVGATAAVAGVFAAGGYGVASAVRDDAPQPQTVATTPSPDPVPPTPTGRPDHADPTPTPRRTGPSEPPAQTGSRSPRTPVATGLLWADGSIDPGSSAYWSQSNITVKTKKALTALTVELRVAPRDRPENTGHWQSRSTDDFDVTVRVDHGTLVYRWTLKQGRTVPAGEHVFAGQYDHAEGERDAGGDTYTVQARTPGQRDDWKGDFE
ncbi:hypothetical protein ACFQVC_05975 [Streptomyces monticola]|uniref:Uncharacterized protein n=1 Tax=Streptomyces monticola TaxID=2666263 RepID=A0ABW2JCS6_9ACTN